MRRLLTLHRALVFAVIGALCLIVPLYAATLLQDTFTGTNGTNLTAHSMNVGSGWTAQDGTCTIQSNAATCTGGTPYASYVADATTGDGILTVDLVIPSASDIFQAAMFRAVDKDNLWFAGVNRSGSGVSTLVLYNRTSGTDNPVGTFLDFSGTVTGTTQTLTITLSGTSIDVKCTDPGHGDNTLATATSSVRQTATKHGMISYDTAPYTAGSFDNFLFTGTGGGGGATPCRRALLGVGCDDLAVQPGQRADDITRPWRVGQVERAHQNDRAAQHQTPVAQVLLHKAEDYTSTVSIYARGVRK